MDIWNPTEEDKKTPEWLQFHTHFLQSGAQQRRDWIFYSKYGKYTDPLPKTEVQRDHAFVKGNYYEIKGCNLHDRAEWVRYIRIDGDYSATASSPTWW